MRDELLDVLALDPSRAPSPRKGFFEIGLDSLTAVELRRRLEQGLDLTLPTSLAFDYPNLESLAEYLCARIAHGMPAAEELAEEMTAKPAEEMTAELDEEDLAASIEKEVAALEVMLKREDRE